MVKIDNDLEPIGVIKADCIDFAIDELEKLFDQTRDKDGYIVSKCGDVAGVEVGSVYDYGRQAKRVYLAIRPNHSIVSQPNLGQAFMTMTPAAATALASLLMLAVEGTR